jgi:hypothetical protein
VSGQIAGQNIVPLVEISFKGSHGRISARCSRQALHEVYNVPIDDRFQLIRECEPEDLIHDSSSLGIELSNDIVIVNSWEVA